MLPSSPSPALQQALATATRALQSGNLALAEMALAPFLGAGMPSNPDLLNIAGTVRMQQGKVSEAAKLFSQAVTTAPREPLYAFNHGLALSRLGQLAEAQNALRAALKRKADFPEAIFELGAVLHRSGKLEEAEKQFRNLLRLMPGHVRAKLALAAVLVDARRPDEAEAPLRRALAETAEPMLKAQLYLQLGQALRRQRKDAEALAALDQSQALFPSLPNLPLHRAETLQNLERFDEALAIFESELARAPGNPELHHDYNALLYQLGRSEEFLKSYDRAPQTREVLMDKAFFLNHEKRDEEAHAIYASLVARDPNDRDAALCAANELGMMNRNGEALAAFEALLARHGQDADLLRRAAEPALLTGDAGKAAWLCEEALRLIPGDGSSLAILSIASRMLEDGREDFLNGYDTLVKSFDLAPPDGFSDMESFNHELNAELDRLHPATREFINQSLRGGTQTPGHLFPAGLPLVTKLKQRIDEAVARYIEDMGEDASHPLRARRAGDFGYAGSWSSRLRDCGFHVNHIHPDGWISSCYYVAVPEAAKDQAARQGWIKFGEPALDVELKTPIRRTIQPVPGRLVLFPSYMWHGTVPFRDTAARTTIAFDVVPA
ncbi:MAG: tetratricopeptide repeat protein [Pseudomonadota bacterium]